MQYQLTNIATSPRVHYDRKRKPVYFNPGETKKLDLEEDDAIFITERALVGLDWKIEKVPEKAPKQKTNVTELPSVGKTETVIVGEGGASGGGGKGEVSQPVVARGKGKDRKVAVEAAKVLTEIQAGMGFFALRKRVAGMIEVTSDMKKADIVARLKELAG